MLDLYSPWMIWYCHRLLENCKSIANICLLFSNVRKSILHYIHPVGRSVDVTINFPLPNNFLLFLLHSSSPPRTKYFPSLNTFLSKYFPPFPLRSFSPPKTKCFPPFPSSFFFSSVDQIFSLSKYLFLFLAVLPLLRWPNIFFLFFICSSLPPQIYIFLEPTGQKKPMLGYR